MTIVDTTTRPAARLLTRLADEELLVGHVLTSIAGFGPELEINLAMSSIGQDELGHSRLWHVLVRGASRQAINDAIWGRAADVDYLATELPAAYTEDWAECVVKHMLYDTADGARLALLSTSDDPDVVAVVAKMASEERFHVDFWTTWLATTARRDRERLQSALDALAPLAGGLFASDDSDQIGIGSAAWTDAESAWRHEVDAALAEHGLVANWNTPAVARTDDVRRIADELQHVYREAPGQW